MARLWINRGRPRPQERPRVTAALRRRQPPAQRVQRGDAVPLHPVAQPVHQHADVLRPVAQQGRCAHHHVGAGQQVLDHVIAAPHARGGGQRGVPQVPMQQRHPGQAQAHVRRRAQVEVGLRPQRGQVDVGLVEAVEQRQAIGPGLHQLQREVAGAAVKRRELDRHRDAHAGLDRAQHLHAFTVDVRPVLGQVGRNAEYVELDGCRARLLELAGKVGPAGARHAVEAGDDRDAGTLRGAAQGFQPLVEHAALGDGGREEAAAGLGVRAAVGLQQGQFGQLGRDDLLFVDRGHDHGRGARIGELADALDAAGQRRGRGHHRMGQIQPEIARAQVDGGHDVASSQCGRKRAPSRAAKSSYMR